MRKSADVASLAEAWIETYVCGSVHPPFAVASLAEAWIETVSGIKRHIKALVASLADIEKSAHDSKRNGRPISPVALEAVKGFDALFEIERQINGLSAEERLAVRQEKGKPLFDDMHAWQQQERATLLKSSDVAKAMDICSNVGVVLPCS